MRIERCGEKEFGPDYKNIGTRDKAQALKILRDRRENTTEG